MRRSESNDSVIRDLAAQDPAGGNLDALRHNQTHTLPPGARIGWLSEPLPEMPEEHLRATDETTRAALGVRDGMSKLWRALHLHWRLVFAIVGCVLVAASAGLLFVLRGSPDLSGSAAQSSATSAPNNTVLPTAVPKATPSATSVPSSTAPLTSSEVARSKTVKSPPTLPTKKPPNGTDNARVDELLFKSR